MQKNTASQVIGVQMVNAADGTAFTGAASVAVTGDGGTQGAGGGTGPTHEGNGFHSYIPTQAETNYDHIGFTFTGSGAIPVTVQVYTRFDSNAIELGGATQSLTDLRDFADAGYDPATNKVQGVVLVDTTTTNTDMVGTDNAALATALATAQTDLDTITGAAGALLDTTATSPQLVDDVWDEVLTGATHNVASSAGRRLRNLQDFGVYEGGAIWLDTVNGTPGTVDFENGTVNNPASTIADALTLASSVGLSIIHVLPSSSITLAASVDGIEFRGFGYTVALGGQSVSGTIFENATVTGNDDGTNATATTYLRCIMGSNTLGKHILLGCQLTGDIVLAEGADYFWDQCYSGVAGTGTPSVDFEAALETKNLSVRHYSGGMEFKNFGTTGTHTASIEGHGQAVLNANCAGGTLAIRGNLTLTDNASGAVTVSDDARIDQTQIGAVTVTELAAIPAASPTLSQAVALLYMALRNKIDVTATTKEVHTDAGGVLATKTLSDNTTTYSETKMA